MKRKLWSLNLLLLALLGVAGWQLRQSYLEARDRERRVLGQTIKTAPKPLVNSTTPPQPVPATDYIDVAEKMLFSRDRNPTVVIEVAPPKPMPALPLAHGVMAFGGEPTIILSEKKGAQQRGYRPGETIGDFKLVAVDNDKVTFEWEGQQIERRLDEILIKNVGPPAPEPAQTATASNALPPSAPGTTVIASETAKSAPGVELTNQERACNPGDTSAAGTVVDGMRKVVSKTPFGDSCRWVPAK